MPDFKYFDDNLAIKYSHINKYSYYTKKAILKMVEQVGKPLFTSDGILKRGVIVRHLILPNHVKNTIDVLDWIYKNVKDDVVVSIMAQYFPSHNANNISDLNRKITKREYNKVENYLYEKNFKFGYIQDIRRK